MTYDQAQSPRLGQRTAVESTFVRMFAGDEIPEAAWPGQLIYRSDDQILQIFNGNAWEDVSGGEIGQLTFVGPVAPTAQHIGDVWFDSGDNNRMYVAHSAGANEIAAGEWEVVSAAAPPITPSTHIYQQDTPPGPADIPPPANNDFWYETPGNHQYYYSSAAPGTHWIGVKDNGIAAAQATADAAIKTAVTEYAVNSSETVAPTTGWSTTAPARTPGTFTWFRTVTTKGDNTSSTSAAALLTGNTGATGPQGGQGVPGPTGSNGQPTFTWVKYADTPTTGMSDDPTNKKYLGLAYNKTDLAESSLYGDYQWSLVQGSAGPVGDPGVPGPPGTNGQPTYTWIKYGTSSAGAGLNDSPTGMTYMGIAYNKTTSVEGTDPTAYEWSLIQGPQGVQGIQGSQGIQGPAGPNGQQLYTWLKYADTPTTGMSDLPAGKIYMGLAYNKTTATESSIYTDYDWSLIQGPQGNTGVQGPPGTNGQPTYTWIKYATNATGTTGFSDTPGTNPYIGIAYNKTTATESSIPTDYEWSLIQGPTGSTGTPGVSITAVTPYFAVVTTGAAAPTQPTNQATPPAPWVTTEPAYVANTELYRTEKISYSNATYSYTVVAKVSAYKAATDAMNVAVTKTRAYYLDGFDPDPQPGDPDHVSWVPLTPALAGVTAFTTGDIWYQTDDLNHPYFWSSGWVDIQNPQIDYSLEQTGINSGDIADLTVALENLSITASSAQNTADTADGRVSMSDYMPGNDDTTYLQIRTDPVTGETTQVETPRMNGSIWFTRTRPRRNICTNPSVETNTTFWTGSQATIARDNPAFVPAGLWTLKVTNSAVVGPHSVSWSSAARTPCVPGIPYTASVYAEMLTGHGTGVQIQICWYSSGGSLISTSSGDPTQLILGGFDPTLIGTGAEPRLWVTDISPATAATFYVQVLSPSGNENDTWHCGALLVEQEDDLGRYFDGDSYDGFWDDVPQNSSSYLEGDKITQLWELRDGDWIRKYLTNDTLWFIDAAKLTGSVSGEILNDNTVEVDKAVAVPVVASETLAAGDLVNIWNNGGIFNMQRACAAAGTNYEAHGFVLDPVPAGTFGRIYHVGYNPLVINLAPGTQWLSTSPGKVTRTPPSAVGTLVQRVGHAPTDSVLDFSPVQPIKIT